MAAAIDGRLTIPDTKSGRPHSLRLPPLALELLGNSEPNDLAFPGQDGGLLSWATPLDRLRHAGPQITERCALRTCSGSTSGPMWSEAVLNHAPPGISGVSDVYMRGELEEQKAAALRLWADEVASIISAPIVSPLRAVS